YLTHAVAVIDGIIDVTPSHVDARSGARTVGGAIGLQTTSIAIGDHELEIGAGAPHQVKPNVVHIPRGGARGGVIEQITNREDGIEQAWWFEAQPLVPGDL